MTGLLNWWQYYLKAGLLNWWQGYLTDDSTIVHHSIHNHEDHPRVRNTKKNAKTPQNSAFPLLPISEQEAKKILKHQA